MNAIETNERHNARIELERDIDGSVYEECRYRGVEECSPCMVIEERLDAMGIVSDAEPITGAPPLTGAKQ